MFDKRAQGRNHYWFHPKAQNWKTCYKSIRQHDSSDSKDVSNCIVFRQASLARLSNFCCQLFDWTSSNNLPRHVFFFFLLSVRREIVKYRQTSRRNREKRFYVNKDGWTQDEGLNCWANQVKILGFTLTIDQLLFVMWRKQQIPFPLKALSKEKTLFFDLSNVAPLSV